MNVSEENGVVPSAAHTHVGFGLKSAAGPFQHGPGSGIGLHVKLQVAQEGRSGPGPAGGFRGGGNQRGNIETRRHQQAIDSDVAGKSSRLSRAQYAQIAAGQPAHTYWIAHAHLLGACREVVAHGSIAVS